MGNIKGKIRDLLNVTNIVNFVKKNSLISSLFSPVLKKTFLLSSNGLGGCYHNTSTLSSLLVLTLFLCYIRYMSCHLYFTISTLPCIYTTRTLLNLYDTSTGILQVRKAVTETNSEQMIKKDY